MDIYLIICRKHWMPNQLDRICPRSPLWLLNKVTTTETCLTAVKPLFVFSQMPQIIHWCQFDNEMQATHQSCSRSRSKYNRLRPRQPMTDNICYLVPDRSSQLPSMCGTHSSSPVTLPTLWHFGADVSANWVLLNWVCKLTSWAQIQIPGVSEGFRHLMKWAGCVK